MTDHTPETPDYDDAESDEVINSAMNGIRAKLEASFDLEAGLADIYARCGVIGCPRRREMPSPDSAAITTPGSSPSSSDSGRPR
jgi:hypothetical protein